MILLILVLCLVGCAYVLYVTTTISKPPSVPTESSGTNGPIAGVNNGNDYGRRVAWPQLPSSQSPPLQLPPQLPSLSVGNENGKTKAFPAFPTNKIKNVCFVRAASVINNNNNNNNVAAADADDNDYATINIAKIGPTLVAIWRELRQSVPSFDAITKNNRWINMLEFQAFISKNTPEKNDRAGGPDSIEMLLTNDRSNGHGPTDEAVATMRRKQQRDREIFMLAHMWEMYTEFEQRNNKIDNDKIDDKINKDAVEKQNKADDRNLSTCLATCMNIFMDATDEEGLAHLAGLIVLYCRTMDRYAIGDARYTELRAVFSVFDPALIALKWREIKRLCAIARNRASVDGRGGGYLSVYTHRQMIGRRKVVVDNPPACLFELYDRTSKRSVLRIDDNIFSKTDKSFATYELRYINRELWRLPKTPPLFVKYATRHFSRVVSSNGIVYDLMSRLDDHDKKGLVCYQPHKTRHRSSDFVNIVESVVATTQCEHKMEHFCYVDHASYEADVTSVVLIDGTRCLFADNAGKSAKSFMILQVFRMPVNERSDVNVSRANGITLHDKNYSGFTFDFEDERLLYPTTSTTPPSTMTLTYNGINDDKHYVLVQTILEGGVGEYSFDEYNSILLRIPVNARAIVRVQHRRKSTLDQGRDIVATTSAGIQNSWLDVNAMSWKFPLSDKKNYRRHEKVIASITVDNYVIPITNSASQENNFSKGAVDIANPSRATSLSNA